MTTSARTSSAICRHCGTPLGKGASAPDGYCCHGCAYVHRLIQDEGLERYYALRGETIQPVGSVPLQRQTFGWLRDLQATLEANENGPRIHKATFHLQGISCVGCVWLIEKLFLRHEGAVRAAADPQRSELRLHWIPKTVRLADFATELQRHGYLLSPEQVGTRDHSRELVGRLALCGVFALNTMLFTLPDYLGMEDNFALADLFSLLTLLFATLSFVVGGSYFLTRAVRALRHRVLHIDLPIALGVTLAYLGALAGWGLQEDRFLYFDFVSIFVFLMLTVRWLQERTVVRNRNEVAAEPEAVTRLTPMGSERIPLAGVEVGDELEIDPGKMVPVSGELLVPEARFSLEWINGESEPRRFPKGRIVPAGATCLESKSVQLRANEQWADSLLARLLAPPAKSRQPGGSEKVLKGYLLVVLALATIGGIGWGIGAGQLLTAWQVILSVLVVSCPCAFGIAQPLADELAIARLRGRGLFVKETSLFPRLRHVRAILFDQTGTVTFQSPALQNPDALDAIDDFDRLVLGQIVERSHHPLSRSLRESMLATGSNLAAPRISISVEEKAGFGLRASDGQGREWTLGREDREGAPDASSDRQIEVVFRCNGSDRAHFQFVDEFRSEAWETVQNLQSRFDIWILSGDHEGKMQALAKPLGLSASVDLAGRSPDAEVTSVNAPPPESTLFLGDGAHDSLTFEQAAVRGTPVIHRDVLEKDADFFLLSRGLGGLIDLFDISARRNRGVRAVFVFAVIYNVAAIPLCLAALITPLLAAILMPLSSLTTLGIVELAYRRSR